MNPRLLLFVLLLTLSLNASPRAHAQKQGADLLKTDILSVLAHPDDETGMASTLAYYARGRDAVIAHAYCTRGEGGGNMVGTHWGPSLGVLRETELKDCLDTLGVRSCYFLGQLDWAYTESAAMTLEKWDKEEALGELVRIIRNLRPEIILTMNPFPRPGQHGHHQAAGMLAVEAFTAAADPARYPDQLKREGIQPWQVRKLYFRGESPGPITRIDAGKPLADGGNAHEIAGDALRNHRSQGFGRFERASFGRPPEAFALVKRVSEAPLSEDNLLAGLPLPPEASVTVERVDPPVSEAVTAHFLPRPAVSRFLAWAREQKISHLVEEIPSDLSVMCKTLNPLTLRLENPTSTERKLSGTVAFEGSGDWVAAPASFEVSVPAHGQEDVTFKILPPAGATEDVTLLAAIDVPDAAEPLAAATTLHPLPVAEIPKTDAPPALDGGDDGWSDLEALAITPDQKVQGSVEGPQDNSGTVRLTYDDDHLYVDVQVRDEQIVSNIAPDDIRGHWRTDAIEICIDPSAQSEHTLNAFKVGIFPFDSTGATRAARDADANQGPIEETAPGMRVHAVKTDGGYRVQTAIPWKAIGNVHPGPGILLGFNVILYDGDKADAALGENINESRLAWAPRRGVQGRPDDWGRLLLGPDGN